MEETKGLKIAPPVVITGRENIKVNKTLVLGASWNEPNIDPFPSYYHIEGEMRVTSHFHIHAGARVNIMKGGVLTLGRGYINNDTRIYCKSTIDIGKDVAIANGVTIRDCDMHSINGSVSVSPISIGDNVWIGDNVTILKGVTIGSGAIIASGSVVSSNVESRTLVGGVPAREIRNNVTWGSELIPCD